MLLKNISKLPQHLLSKQKQCFSSSERVRNFFEVNPIYPDYTNQDGPLFRDQSKQAFNTNQDSLEKIKKNHMKQMYNKSKQYVRKQMIKEKKLKNNQEKFNNKQSTSIKERAVQIAESILVDQESQLMFGFGFDNFIQQLKEQKTKDAEGEYLQRLQQILFKLNIKNDTELVNLYKYIVAQNTKDNFRDESRKIIIKNILKEISNIKQDAQNVSKSQQFLDKYLDYSNSSKEFILDQYKEGTDNNILSEQLQNSLKQDEVDIVSQNLAISNLEEKIKINKTYEVKNKDTQIFSSDFSDDPDYLGYKEQEQKVSKLMGLSTTNSPAQSLNDWKTEQIYSEIKTNFQKNKELYEEQVEKDVQQSKPNQSGTEFFEFLKNDSTDEEINRYLRSQGLLEELQENPNFEEILDNIDYLIDNAPLSLKSNIQKNSDTSKFTGNFITQDLNEQDLMWSNFEKNFLKVFPTGTIPAKYQNDQKKQGEEDTQAVCTTEEISTIYEYEVNLDQEENIRNHIYSEKDLEEDSRIELEVYRRIKQDPFFSHYIQNDLRYFSERMVEGYNETTRYMKLYDKSGDILNYNEVDLSNRDSKIQILEQDEPDVKFNQKQQIEEELKERVFAGGKRKKSHCLVQLTKGSGKVTINRKKYLDYFPHPIQRNVCLKPIYIANIPCMYDVNIHVRGGGVFGQSECISVGLARAISKLYPHLRQKFIEMNYIKTDPRTKERKKTGQYKARKGWTYVRR